MVLSALAVLPTWLFAHHRLSDDVQLLLVHLIGLGVRGV